MTTTDTSIRNTTTDVQGWDDLAVIGLLGVKVRTPGTHHRPPRPRRGQDCCRYPPRRDRTPVRQEGPPGLRPPGPGPRQRRAPPHHSPGSPMKRRPRDEEGRLLPPVWDGNPETAPVASFSQLEDRHRGLHERPTPNTPEGDPF